MNSTEKKYDVIIVGGGLAGLVIAILLARKKITVLLIEKKAYPFHKVCGEYISNEVLDFLKSIGFDPFIHGASAIDKLRISTPAGKNIYAKLDLGGFGLSRFTMDHALVDLAKKNGADIVTEKKVTDISFAEDHFNVKLDSGKSLSAKLVIGSYGKRDMLDKKFKRDFIKEHTGYLGVKYHVKINYPIDEVGLDNFKGGYCGIVKVENDTYNICYLYKRNPAVSFNSIAELEKKVLFKNPIIQSIFSNAQFIFDEPEVINEISFAPRNLVDGHVLMCGDSAGLITPLCGNGMAIAIHSAKLLSALIVDLGIMKGISLKRRATLEADWQKIWNENFNRRLKWGRRIQTIFGRSSVTNIGMQTLHTFPPLERWLISKTHGKRIGVVD